MRDTAMYLIIDTQRILYSVPDIYAPLSSMKLQIVLIMNSIFVTFYLSATLLFL